MKRFILLVFIFLVLIGCYGTEGIRIIYVKNNMNLYNEDYVGCYHEADEKLGYIELDPIYKMYVIKCMEKRGYLVNQEYKNEVESQIKNKRIIE